MQHGLDWLVDLGVVPAMRPNSGVLTHFAVLKGAAPLSQTLPAHLTAHLPSPLPFLPFLPASRSPPCSRRLVRRRAMSGGRSGSKGGAAKRTAAPPSAPSRSVEVNSPQDILIDYSPFVCMSGRPRDGSSYLFNQPDYAH